MFSFQECMGTCPSARAYNAVAECSISPVRVNPKSKQCTVGRCSALLLDLMRLPEDLPRSHERLQLESPSFAFASVSPGELPRPSKRAMSTASILSSQPLLSKRAALRHISWAAGCVCHQYVCLQETLCVCLFF